MVLVRKKEKKEEEGEEEEVKKSREKQLYYDFFPMVKGSEDSTDSRLGLVYLW